MFRYLREMTVRFWHGVRYAISETWALATMPFRNLRPGQLRAKLAQDRADLSASRQMIFTETSKTASGLVRVAARSPFDFGRWLAVTPGRLWRFLRSRTLGQLGLLTVYAALLLTAVTVPPWIWYTNRQQQKYTKRYQQQLESHLVNAEFEGTQSDLTALLLVSPRDQLIQGRLKAMSIGEAAPDDPKMARLLMLHHRGMNRQKEAVREAKKYLEHTTSSDWIPYIILAEAALATGHTAEAANWVAKLSSTADADRLHSMWTCSTAASIFQELGDEPRLDDLTEHVTKTFIPLLPKRAVANADAASQVQLLEMYVLSLRHLAKHPDLLELWGEAQALADRVLAIKDLPLPVLYKLGMQLEAQRTAALNLIDQLKLMSRTKLTEMAAQLDERLSAIWTRVRAMEPKLSLGYIGPANLLSRAGDIPGALSMLEQGINAAGPQPELIEKKADLLRQTDPAEAYRFLEASLGGAPKTPSQCRALAFAALASKQTDRARDAVKRGQELLPNAPWLTILEAEVDLQANRPTDATLALRKLLHLIPNDPDASRLYVRAQCACGAAVLAEQFLIDMMEKHQGSTSAVLLGSTALLEAGEVGRAIKVLRVLSHREPLNLAASIMLAECLNVQAEYRNTGWTRGELEEAMSAYRAGLRKFPDQLEFVSRIAWLELMAMDAPRQAYTTAAPLREAKDLPPDGLRTVGAIYAYNGEYEQARIKLERALKQSGPQAGTLALLALAQHGLNHPAEAKDALEQSKSIERATPREVELRNAIEKKIRRGSKS